MLLALDAGNSNITIGAFEERKLLCQWRLRTVQEQTADEWGILLRNLFEPAGLDIGAVEGMIISSVVPPIDSTLALMAERYFHTAALFVGPRTDLGLTIRYDNPNEVGADRLVNGVAGFFKYGGPCVIVDLGTTINFDVISRDGEYLGGAIAVGIGIAIEALFARTARLPLVDFRAPLGVIGTNTVASMQSGLFYGAVGMIDGILERIIQKMGPETKTVATGGQAHLIVSGSRFLKTVDEHLTLEGLQMIWERNRGAPPAAVNYFNYFTEIEEHFQRARGTALFLMSPLDWALVESWKNAEVPLEAVLRGIDAAFEKWRSRKVKTQMVNSLAFCAQAVLTEAQIMAGTVPARQRREAAPPFALDDLRGYLEANAAALPEGYEEAAASLRRLAGDVEQHYADLEGLEQRLTVLEEKILALARARQSEDELLESRRELDRQLRPYRGKMTAEQLTMLEKQYLERILLEKARLPRLSLFYMR